MPIEDDVGHKVYVIYDREEARSMITNWTIEQLEREIADLRIQILEFEIAEIRRRLAEVTK